MTETVPIREILAPAGSVEQLVAAVNNGCDSVYLGLDSFNARMKAPNFTRNNFQYWLDYCHLLNVKVYVTINTSLKNDEFAQAVDLLKFIYQCGADGVIVTDLALMRIAARFGSDNFEIVASTQLNIHDKSGAEFAKNCGATTVVCARECSLEEIREIAQTGVKVECFIHGATCVCQSGQCLFSSLVGGNSGNRGLCAQPCRKLYSADGGKNFSYLLSARDLCGLDIAEDLCKAGVSTYKIEGRNRRAEYAGITSRIYSKLFDNNFEQDSNARKQLTEIYNRDMSALQYLRGGNSDIISPLCQNHAGVEVGKVYKNQIETKNYITKGDGFKVFEKGREVCGAIALESGIGLIRAKFSGRVKDGMVVNRTTPVELCHEILAKRRSLPVKLKFIAHSNELVEITASCNMTTVVMQSDFVVQAAETKPTTSNEIIEQLQKTGDSSYTISDIELDIGNIFLAKSQINALRRNILKKMTEALLLKYENRRLSRNSAEADAKFLFSKQKQLANKLQIAVICYTEEQLCAAQKYTDLLIFKPEDLDSTALELAKKYTAFLDIPSFAEKDIFEKVKNTRTRIVCHNIGQVEWARQLNLDFIAGSGLNIFNDFMAEEFSDAVTFVYSQELTLTEISSFANRSGLIFVDGQLVLMKLVHCPYKVATGCTCSSCCASIPLCYTDEQGNEFKILRRRSKRCSFELINGKKLSVVARIVQAGGYLMDFNESVVRHYKLLNEGVNDGYLETEPYTKGRLVDKVN